MQQLPKKQDHHDDKTAMQNTQYANDTWTLDDNFGMGRSGAQVPRPVL